MRHEHRIPAKAISILLAVVMLMGCISVGFTAYAVEDTYQALADAMRAEGMQGVIPSYKVSSSPSIKNKLSAADPKASSAVYVQSTAMWEAMEAFWKIAGSLKTKDVGDITVGENGNVYEGWTGENNTARKLASAVAEKLVSGGYLTADEMRVYKVLDTFSWFIGGYTAEHALLDDPVRGEKPAMLPWTVQVFGSTGYFGATRTRDQALLSGTKNYRQIPTTLELNRRWAWEHEAKYARNGAGNARQYWHVLGAMSTQGNVAGAKGLAFDPAQANTAALKAALGSWESTFTSAFFNQDLSAMSTAQLEAAGDKAQAQMAAAKALKLTNTLLYFYGLPTFLDVGAFQRKVNYHLELSPYRPYVDFFKNAKPKQLKDMSRAALNEEVLNARLNLDVLETIARNNRNVYAGLIQENGLSLQAAEEYFGDILYAISEVSGGVDDLVQIIRDAINGSLVRRGTGTPFSPGPPAVPADPYYYVLQPALFVYPERTPGPGTGLTLDDLYELYERVAMAYEALTGKIGSQANFYVNDHPNPAKSGTVPFDAEYLDFKLNNGGALDAPNAAQLALSAIRQAITDRNPAVYYDYKANAPTMATTAPWVLNDNYPVGETWYVPPDAPETWERYPDVFDASKPSPLTPAGRPIFFNDTDPLTEPLPSMVPAPAAVPDQSDYAASIFVAMPLLGADLDDYISLAEGFIASDLAALIGIINEQYPTLPVHLVPPTLAVGFEQDYADELDTYIAAVIDEYQTLKDNYDDWLPVYTWIQEYITDWAAAVIPPPLDAGQDPLPDRNDYAATEYEVIVPGTPPTKYWENDEYLADALDYITNGVAHGGNYVGTGMTTTQRAFFEGMTGSSLPTTANEAQIYLMMLGYIEWDANAEFPTSPDGYPTTMQTQYEYLINLPIRSANFYNYQGYLQQMLTVPRNAYNNLITKQKEFETAVAGGTAAQVNAARINLVSAANTYNDLWEAGDRWTADGTAPYVIAPPVAAEDTRLAIRNLDTAKSAYAEVNNRIVTLNRYALFFNPYRMSLVDQHNFSLVGAGMTYRRDAGSHTDWSRYSDSDLRAELAAAQAAIAAYRADGVYGDTNPNNTFEEWLKYLGRDNDDGNYNANVPPLGADDEDDLSVFGEIRFRVKKLLDAMEMNGDGTPKYSLDDYLSVMDPDTGAFRYPPGGPPAPPTGSGDLFVLTIGLFGLISLTDYGCGLDPVQIAYAQRILAAWRGLYFEYETLHWELMDPGSPNPINPGTVENPNLGGWYPVREVDQTSSIVLVFGQDEFVVRYEHIENFINKLDTLLTSNFVKELMGPDGFDLSFNGGETTSPAAGGPAVMQAGSAAANGLGTPTFHVPELAGDVIMRLGEMRYSSEELVIENPNTGIKIVLPPLDTQLDTTRWADEAANMKAQRRWIQAYRADVLLYLLHTIFDAINTGEVEGREMLSWLLKMFISDAAVSVNGQPAELYVAAMPANVQAALGGVVEQVVDYTLGQVDLTAAVEPFLTELLGGLVSGFLYGDDLPNTVLGLYKMLCDLVAPIFEQPIMGVGGFIDDIPILGTFTVGTILTFMQLNSVSQLLGSAIGKSLLNMGGIGGGSVINVLEVILGAQILPGELLRKCWPSDWPRPGNPNPTNDYMDINPQLWEIYRWLGNLDGQFSGDTDLTFDVVLSESPYSAKTMEFFNNKKTASNVKPTAATSIFGNLNTPDEEQKLDFSFSPFQIVSYEQKFKYNSLFAWYHLDKVELEWGIKSLNENNTLAERQAQRRALEDIMAFTMSGLSLVLSAVFGDNGLNVSFGEGLNSNAAKDDKWYIDIDILKTILDLVSAALTTVILGWGVPNFLLNLLPNWIWNNGLQLYSMLLQIWPGASDVGFLYMSNWFGDNDYDSNEGWPHWRGRYDSRAGLYAELTPINAYGRIFIPLFEALNIDPILFGSYDGPQAPLNQNFLTAVGSGKTMAQLKGSYDEVRFNDLMKAYGGNVSILVFALNLANDDDEYGGVEGKISKQQAKEALKELSRIMVSALLEPIFNWIDPVFDQNLIPYSIGYRPVGKILDLLPNLAFVAENRLIGKLVDQVIGEMTLTAELCLGGLNLEDLWKLIYDKDDPAGAGLIGALINPLIDALVGGIVSLIDRIFDGAGSTIGFLLDLGIRALLNNFVFTFINEYVGRFLDMGFGFLNDWFYNRDRDDKRSDLGSFLGFFAGDDIAQRLNIKIIDGMNVQDDLLTSFMDIPNGSAVCTECGKIHAKGILGYLDHSMGLDLTGRLQSLLQNVLGLLGIADGDISGNGVAPAVDPFILELIDKVVQKESHIEGVLLELFNPQTYPNKTFMVYPMVGDLKAPGGGGAKLNEVNYSDVWTRAKADFLNNNLMEMLDKWWEFLFAEPFLPWLWDMFYDLLGFDVSNLYTRGNLDAILGLLSGLLGGLDISGLFDNDMMQSLLPHLGTVQHLLDIDDVFSLLDSLKYLDSTMGEIDVALADATAAYRALVKTKVAALNVQFADGNRDAFADVIYGLLAPLAPVLKIFLTGGRTTDAKGNLIETLWYGELYPNNGAKDLGYWDPGSGFLNQDDNADGADDYVWNTKRYTMVDGNSFLFDGELVKPPATLSAAAKLTYYNNLYLGGAGNTNYTPGAVIPNAWDRARPSDVPVLNQPGFTGGEYDPKGTFYTIGAEGNNLTLIEDYLGFSGYDGYRHGLIPIYEHLGVPKADIPTYQQFVLRSTNTPGQNDGDIQFFKMLVDPILGLLDRIVADPINTVIEILPNLLYFLTAEATGADQDYADAKYGAGAYKVFVGSTTCLNECLNRLLRPIYAILDMLAPLFTVEEIITQLLPSLGLDIIPADMLTDGGLPLVVEFSGIVLEIDLPLKVSLNSIVANLLTSIDLMGLSLGGLTDLTALITGELELYLSQSGQDDAVRMKGTGDLPDLLTNLMRQLIDIIFNPANKPVIMGLIEGLPDILMPTVVQLLENIYGLMSDRTLQGHIGTDLVLSMLFYLLYDANSLVDDLLFQRNTYTARIASFFEIIANSSSPQLRRYAERARRFLNQLYGDIITPDRGVQKNGFVKFISDFWARILAFFTGIGDWFMRLIRWIFPFFF